MPKIRTILLPTDFSACSQAAQQYAFNFAQEQGSSLLILHVIEEIYLTEDAWDPLVLNPDLFKEIELRASKKLDAIVAKARGRNFRVTRIIERGMPFSTIVRVASKKKPDLLIMGTHGRTGLKHVLLGSTAEKVIRHSPVPVLTIRCDERKLKVH